MQVQEKERQFEFLSNNSSPTIRHLLFRDIGDDESKEFKDNLAALLHLPVISRWKNNIPKYVTGTTILGSGDACFENSYGKLLSFGLSVDELLTENLLHKYTQFLNSDPSNEIYDSLARFVVAVYLLITGCSHNVVRSIVSDRIELLYNFVTTSPFKLDIYCDASTANLPSVFKSKKLVNPALYENGELALPTIHDIFVFSHIYNLISQNDRGRIDAIIEYIAQDGYQSMDYGYGIIKSAKNKFHSMGWSAHLPFYNKNLSSAYFKKGLIFRMALFSRFENTNIRRWIGQILKNLEEFRIDDYRYCFPSGLLPEVPNSYFLNGRHTSLNENRRQKSGRVVESTYYAYLINRNA